LTNERFLKKQRAYRDLFSHGNTSRGFIAYIKRIFYCILWVPLGKKKSYQTTFDTLSPAAERVLADLLKYGNYHSTTFHLDPHIQSYQNGKRDVIARIIGFTNFTDEELRRFNEE